jgi:phenylacetate-CoA ligase
MYGWLVPRIMFPLYERFSGHRPWSGTLELQRLQWRSPEDAAARSLEKLRRLLGHAAAHVPYYRQLFRTARIDPHEVRSLSDLSRVPITGKAEIGANFPVDMIADNLPASRRCKLRTSGSSGVPFEFYADRASFDGWLSSYLFFGQWDGTQPGDMKLRIGAPLQGNRHVMGSSGIQRTVRRLLFGGRIVRLPGVDLTLDRFLDETRKFARGRRYYLSGYPSYITRLAAQLLDQGVELPAYPRGVTTVAETLTPANAAIIERAFGCRVTNLYSSWEAPHLAQTCPENPEALHVISERAIVSVVRADGSPTGRGEPGRILLTSLENCVMPLINYDIGDWAVAGAPCPCGRGFPTLQSLEGRTLEMIRTLGGKMISPATLCNFMTFRYPVGSFVSEYQAVQTAAHAVVLRVVPTSHFGPEFAERVRRSLEELLGTGMTVRLEAMDWIPAEASGKRLIIKSQLPPP